MKLKPLADRVVVVSIENEEVVKGGIVLPTAAKEKPQMAEVISVGPGGVVDGNLVTGQNPGSAKATAEKVAALLT